MAVYTDVSDEDLAAYARLAAKLERGMAQIHAWRADLAAEVLG